MFRRILLGSAVVLFFFSINAFSQAAAESALTHSASGAAGAKTGSALGGALNKAFQKTGKQVANSDPATGQRAATPQTGTPAPPDASAIPNRAAVQDASLVQFSLRGSGTNCPAPLDWKHRQQTEPSDNNNLTVCGLHTSAGPFPKTKYKPVVEISF
jgi:hypothetical protein